MGHTSLVSTVVFSPNGNNILTGGYDNTAILWKTLSAIIDWLKSEDCPVRQLTEEEKVEFGLK